jgi:hypothetical protein
MDLVYPLGSRIYTVNIRSVWQDLADRTGIFYPDKAEWMIPDLIGVHGAGLGAGAFLTRVKNAGELLSADQKRAMGINPRIKIGDRAAVTLTRKGLEDVNESLSAIFMEPMMLIFRRAAHHDAVDLGCPMSLSIHSANTVCLAALEQHGKLYAAGEAPTMPLPACDRICCGCVFRADYDARQAVASATASGADCEPASPPPGPPAEDTRSWAAKNRDDLHLILIVTAAMVALVIVVGLLT